MDDIFILHQVRHVSHHKKQRVLCKIHILFYLHNSLPVSIYVIDNSIYVISGFQLQILIGDRFV